jgi:signal transduction histidine kinase
VSRRPGLEQFYSWMRARPLEADAGFAGALALVLVLLPWVAGTYGSSSVLAFVLLIAPLAWRRTQPVTSCAAVAVIAFAQVTLTTRIVPADAVVIISLYSVTVYGPRWASRLALVGAWVGVFTAVTRNYGISPGYVPIFLTLSGGLVTATWALGTLRRLGRRELERLAERARLLETEREQEARLAATDERARIAREMHDVVAHSLSVTISQADGGRYAARTDPEAAVAALETISATGRQALADMRVLLGVLRQDDAHELAPQPDTDAIPELVRQVSAGGLPVRFEVTGRPRALPPGPALAAYRIVQEALTNVLKHGGPQAHAAVWLNWRDDGLEIRVEDDGRGAGAPPAASTGQGLLGMRERATLHNGQLHAGPRDGGGWRVHALLPYAGGTR